MTLTEALSLHTESANFLRRAVGVKPDHGGHPEFTPEFDLLEFHIDQFWNAEEIIRTAKTRSGT